jgi:hypothetical protein
LQTSTHIRPDGKEVTVKVDYGTVRRLTDGERAQQMRLAFRDHQRSLPPLPKRLPASPFINPLP